MPCSPDKPTGNSRHYTDHERCPQAALSNHWPITYLPTRGIVLSGRHHSSQSTGFSGPVHEHISCIGNKDQLPIDRAATQDWGQQSQKDNEDLPQEVSGPEDSTGSQLKTVHTSSHQIWHIPKWCTVLAAVLHRLKNPQPDIDGVELPSAFSSIWMISSCMAKNEWNINSLIHLMDLQWWHWDAFTLESVAER